MSCVSNTLIILRESVTLGHVKGSCQCLFLPLFVLFATVVFELFLFNNLLTCCGKLKNCIEVWVYSVDLMLSSY